MMKMLIFTILLLKNLHTHCPCEFKNLKTNDSVTSTNALPSLGLSNDIKSKPNQHLPVTGRSGVN